LVVEIAASVLITMIVTIGDVNMDLVGISIGIPIGIRIGIRITDQIGTINPVVPVVEEYINI
jgi:hypothetical protein